jgi:hypothetical protein
VGDLGWAVQIYNAAEALPNLINPFWMLPLRGRRARVVGFTFLQLLVASAGGAVPAMALAYTLPLSSTCHAVTARHEQKINAQEKKLERNDDSKMSHQALET